MRFFPPQNGQKDDTEFDDGEMDEDGYWGMLGSTSKRELIGRMFRDLANVIPKKLWGGRGRDMGVEPGTLILVRHGESLWNANKTFTGEYLVATFEQSFFELFIVLNERYDTVTSFGAGWADPDLSPQGYREVEHAAR